MKILITLIKFVNRDAPYKTAPDWCLYKSRRTKRKCWLNKKNPIFNILLDIFWSILKKKNLKYIFEKLNKM